MLRKQRKQQSTMPGRPVIRTTRTRTTRTKGGGVLMVVPSADGGALRRRRNQALVLLLVVAALVSMLGSARLLQHTLPTMDTITQMDVKINLPRTTHPPRSKVASTASVSAVVSTTATHFSKLGGTPGSSPSPKRSPSSSSSSSRMFSQTLLAAYNMTVANAVNVHASIWNYMTPYHHLQENALEGRCAAIQTAHQRSNIPKYQRQQQTPHHPASASASASARGGINTTDPPDEKKEAIHKTIEHNTQKIQTLPAGFLCDTVANITGYFTQLATACAQRFPEAKTTEPKTNVTFDALVTTFEHDCLEFMHSLAYAPRCTTRMDSRYDCAQLAARAAASNTVMTEDVTTFMTKTAHEVIETLFVAENQTNNATTLNIVIQGTGPSGLMLASALLMLSTRYQHRVQQNSGNEKIPSQSFPALRLLLLDTRADGPGIKTPYQRNWQAELDLRHFQHERTDPRLAHVLSTLTPFAAEGLLDDHPAQERMFTLPLNVLETLLFLSNQDHQPGKTTGKNQVQFLFGINPNDLVPALRNIPNLLVVDATGHRLEPLHRGGTSCASSTPPEEEEEEGAAERSTIATAAASLSSIRTATTAATTYPNYHPRPHPVPFPWEVVAAATKKTYKKMKQTLYAIFIVQNTNITDYYQMYTQDTIFAANPLQPDVYEYLEQRGHRLHVRHDHNPRQHHYPTGTTTTTTDDDPKNNNLLYPLDPNHQPLTVGWIEIQGCSIRLATLERTYQQQQHRAYYKDDVDDAAARDEEENSNRNADEDNKGDKGDDDEADVNTDDSSPENNDDDYADDYADNEGTSNSNDFQNSADDNTDPLTPKNSPTTTYAPTNMATDPTVSPTSTFAPTNKATDLSTANIANSCTEGFEYCETLQSCIEPAGKRGKCPDDLFDSLHPTNSDFCDYCNSKDGGVGDKEIKYCNQICYTSYDCSSLSLFRSDITALVTKQRFHNSFAYHSDRGWYPLYGYYFNPSVVLLSIIQRILHDAGYANNINGMPLRELYPNLQYFMLRHENDARYQMSDKELQIVQAMKLIHESEPSLANWPRVTFTVEAPYIYTEGYKQKQSVDECSRTQTCNLSDLLENDTRMIRIGDSLTTGGGLKGRSLFNHATMIGTFADAILYKWEQVLAVPRPQSRTTSE